MRPRLLRPRVLVTGGSGTTPSPLCSHQRPLPARAQVLRTSCGTLRHPSPKPVPVQWPRHGAVCPCCTGEPRAALSTAARGRHAGWAGAAQLASPETPRETCPSLKPVLRRESGRARCHPERPELPPPAHPAWQGRSYRAPRAAEDPAGVQGPRAGGPNPSPAPRSLVPGSAAARPWVPRGCAMAGAGRGVGRGRNPGLSHGFLCAP